MRQRRMVFARNTISPVLPFLAAMALLTMMSGVGCRMCASPDDYAYPAYGGIWERTDRYHGRVGSAFAPAGAPLHAAPAREDSWPLDGWPGGIPLQPPAEEVEPREGQPLQGDLAGDGTFPEITPANEVLKTSTEEEAASEGQPSSEEASSPKLEPVVVEPPLVEPPAIADAENQET